MANRSEVLYQDFSARLLPRLLWESAENGTAIRTRAGYAAKPAVEKIKKRITDAEDNAIGRALRRRQHKLDRGWLPYAKR